MPASNVCAYACMQLCVHVCMICRPMHVCMYIMYMYIYACMHVYMYVYMHICKHACLYVCSVIHSFIQLENVYTCVNLGYRNSGTSDFQGTIHNVGYSDRKGTDELAKAEAEQTSKQ